MQYSNYFSNCQPPQMTPTMLSQQQRLAQMEQQYPQFVHQYQQQNHVPMLNGRMIENIDSVVANEVPMDGSVSLFPLLDMSIVYARQWQNDGTLKTLKYVLDKDTENLSKEEEKSKFALSEEFTEGIMKRFDSLDGRLDKLEQSITPKTTRATKKASE